MSVNGINTAGNVYESYAKQPAAAVNENAAKASSVPEESKLNADTFEKSDASARKETGYDKLKRIAQEKIDGYKSVQEDNLRNLVSELLSKQAGIKRKSTDTNADLLNSLQQSGAVEGVAAAEQAGESEDWGIDAVATRIMDMAISLSGGDSSKLETLRNAVTKGFEQAGVEFGKELPDISQNTYKEVMKRFDYWKENGSMDNYSFDAAAYTATAANKAE